MSAVPVSQSEISLGPCCVPQSAKNNKKQKANRNLEGQSTEMNKTENKKAENKLHFQKQSNSGAKWRAVFCLGPSRGLGLALVTSRNKLHNLVSSGLPVCADADAFSPMFYML